MHTKVFGIQKQMKALGVALEAATSNRSLTVRAHQAGLMEVKDVIESQMMESFVKAQYRMLGFRHFQTVADLELVVGKEIADIMTGS